jgi:hypothetical protein
MRRSLFLFATLLALAGCQSTRTPEPIALGFTADQVRDTMGRPLRVVPQGGGEIWEYRDRPRDPNDHVRLGYRRRVEFDPVRRTNVIIYEAVDDRLFPNLRTHTIRITLRDGRVAAVDSTEDL